jgi:hypothetical protein
MTIASSSPILVVDRIRQDGKRLQVSYAHGEDSGGKPVTTWTATLDGAAQDVQPPAPHTKPDAPRLAGIMRASKPPGPPVLLMRADMTRIAPVLAEAKTRLEAWAARQPEHIRAEISRQADTQQAPKPDAEPPAFAQWCPPTQAPQVRRFAGAPRLWIEFAAEGTQLRIWPEGAEPVTIPRPRGVPLRALARSLAKETGHRHVEVWRREDSGEEYRAELLLEAGLSAETLAEAGRAAFGHHWQVPLAAALKVNERTVRRWAANGAPARLVADLRPLLETKSAEIARVLETLGK